MLPLELDDPPPHTYGIYMVNNAMNSEFLIKYLPLPLDSTSGIKYDFT